MLSIFTTDTPPPVSDDPAVRETERALKEADTALQKMQPRYTRAKSLVAPPANQTLADMGATPEEQDEAFATFPDVARQYHQATEHAQGMRRDYDLAYAAATAGRIRWYEAQRDEQVASLVAVIEEVYNHVQRLHDLAKQAEREHLTLTPPDFPRIPLYIGSPTMGGLEQVIEQVRALVKR